MIQEELYVHIFYAWESCVSRIAVHYIMIIPNLAGAISIIDRVQMNRQTFYVIYQIAGVAKTVENVYNSSAHISASF